MDNQIKKFLEFNGKAVYFLSAKGVWWIAIKPICEALGVNYNRQFQNLKSNKTLGQLFAIQQIVAADGRLREMVCLPEFYVYGWIFKIQSESKELEAYQWKCYELLYNYFHGAVSDRYQILKAKTLEEIEIETLKQQLQEKPEYKRLVELENSAKKKSKLLQELDKKAIAEQLSLWQMGF